MRSIRKTIAALLSLCLVFALAGCGEKKEGRQETTMSYGLRISDLLPGRQQLGEHRKRIRWRCW